MLARLTEEVGELARAMNIKFGGKKSKFEGDGKDIKDEIADVLYTLLALANNLELNLDEEFIKKVKESHEKCKEVYSK
jgi:NTP pyrophosphatase (non-canonical NTP hydrolase)